MSRDRDTSKFISLILRHVSVMSSNYLKMRWNGFRACKLYAGIYSIYFRCDLSIGNKTYLCY